MKAEKPKKLSRTEIMRRYRAKRKENPDNIQCAREKDHER